MPFAQNWEEVVLPFCVRRCSCLLPVRSFVYSCLQTVFANTHTPKPVRALTQLSPCPTVRGPLRCRCHQTLEKVRKSQESEPAFGLLSTRDKAQGGREHMPFLYI